MFREIPTTTVPFRYPRIIGEHMGLPNENEALLSPVKAPPNDSLRRHWRRRRLRRYARG